jgi:ACS family tartrate transporter-like MFS transporter
VTGLALPIAEPEIGRATIRRVTWRLMPFLVVAYLFSIIDRSNIGFASLQMNRALGLSQTVFGLAGGIYFIAYFLFEVPSNLALERFGASRWIARVMISWGLVAGATALCVGPTSLFVMRFLLGATEAGFFPGVILYLTYWFPSGHRARMIGIFMVSIPAANALGSPIAGYLLAMDGAVGLQGWQWLFVLEAVPTVLLGIAAYGWLTDRPAHARWLSPAQRDWLAGALERDAALRAVNRAPSMSLWRTLLDRRVLFLALVSASTTTVSTALAIWQPIIMRSFGLSYIESGFVNALPYVAACVAMVLWGRRSDRTGERLWHNALPMIVVVLGFAGLLVFTSLWPSVLLLTLVMVGTYACKGPFWAMSSEWLPRGAAAAGLAQISAVANLAGFFASYLIGAIKDATGSYPLSLAPLMLLCAAGTVALIVLALRRPAR